MPKIFFLAVDDFLQPFHFPSSSKEKKKKSIYIHTHTLPRKEGIWLKARGKKKPSAWEVKRTSSSLSHHKDADYCNYQNPYEGLKVKAKPLLRFSLKKINKIKG